MEDNNINMFLRMRAMHVQLIYDHEIAGKVPTVHVHECNACMHAVSYSYS